MYLATKTLAAINAAIEADQGNSYRAWLGRVMPHIGDIYRQEPMPFRGHLGASIIGGDCARAVWYDYRWATLRTFPGRILRLFNRGHIEEARVIAALLMIGVDVYQQDENGKQFRISGHNGNYGGSGDGQIIGLPDLPHATKALLEIKTHNDKSFSKLVSEGVRKAKPEHYVQMTQYMMHMSLSCSLYVGVNKNDDHMHLELIARDDETAGLYFERAGKIIEATEPPKRAYPSPGSWGCKWCDHKMICHFGKDNPMHRSCRTCAFGKPFKDGEWVCMRDGHLLDEPAQLAACHLYEQMSNK